MKAKKKCRNCHFLIKVNRSRDDKTGKINTYSSIWTDDERKTSKIPEYYFAECYHMVWSIGVKQSLKKELPNLIKIKRDNCFYYSVQEGMTCKAAAVLQEREAQNSQLNRTNKYATIGLWIAGIGLFFSVSVNIFALVSILKHFKFKW